MTERSKRITQRCGEQLRRLREAAGLSRTQMERKTGRDKSILARMEHGERRIEVVDFMDLCTAAGKDPAEALQELFKEVDCNER